MVKIRNAGKDDIDSLLEIEEECFSLPWSRQGFCDAMCMDNTLFFVAVEEVSGVTPESAAEFREQAGPAAAFCEVPESAAEFREQAGPTAAFCEVPESENAAASAKPGEIAGYCGLYQMLDEGEITNIAVRAPYRRQQIGGRLLAAMQAEAAKRGVRRIFLEVRKSNLPARRLYEKSGFTVCGQRKGFYEKPKEDAILMVWEEKGC